MMRFASVSFLRRPAAQHHGALSPVLSALACHAGLPADPPIAHRKRADRRILTRAVACPRWLVHIDVGHRPRWPIWAGNIGHPQAQPTSVRAYEIGDRVHTVTSDIEVTERRRSAASRIRSRARRTHRRRYGRSPPRWSAWTAHSCCSPPAGGGPWQLSGATSV